MFSFIADLVDRQDRAIGHNEGLAVGWRTDECVDRDASVRTRAILDHHGLTEALLEPAANDAGYGVGHSSRRICYDEFDRSTWRLRLRGPLHRCAHRQRRKSNERGT